MTTTKLTRIAEEFAALLEKRLEGFAKDWKKPWFCEGGGWPRNLAGREYNGHNAFLLMMASGLMGYKYPIFTTTACLDALGTKEGPFLHVLKGEKAWHVSYSNSVCRHYKDGFCITMPEYHRLDDKDKAMFRIFQVYRCYPVFNISQTNLEEAYPDIWEKLAAGYKPFVNTDTYMFVAADRLIGRDGWCCPIDEVHGDKACYSVADDRITVPEKSQFKDNRAFYGTLFHEMAHSTGAEGRLGRFKSGFDRKGYAVEELVAEMTSALVTKRYGIDTGIKEESCAYLKSWLDAIGEDPMFIRGVIGDVKNAAAMIIRKLDGDGSVDDETYMGC